MSNNKYTFLIKNTTFFTIANFSNKLIVFFLLPFYTSFLTVEEYAIIDLISTTQQLLFPIITLSISEAVIRFCMERENNKGIVFTIGVTITLLGNIIIVFIGGIAALFYKDYILYILCFLFFSALVSINTLLSSFLKTIDKIGIITIASIVGTLITTFLNIVLIAVFRVGIEGYYISFILGNTFSVVYMAVRVDIFHYIYICDKKRIKETCKVMLVYSLPLIPNALFWWVNSSLDRYFLTVLSSLSYVGLYAAANKIPAILSTITSIFQQAWGLSLFKENESTSKQEFFNNVFNFYNLLILGTSVLLIFFSKYICLLLLSKEFINAWTWVPWLLIGFYSNSISSFIGTEFTAAKKTSCILITTALGAFVNIALNILLIPIMQGFGAAIATCISYFMTCEIRIFIVKKKFGLKLDNFRICFIHMLLTLMTIFICYIDNLLSYLIAIIIILIICTYLRKDIWFLFINIKKILRKNNES